MAIVLSVLRLTASDYPFGILWPLYCLSFDLRLLITPLVSCGHCVVCPSNYVSWLPLWYLVAIVLSLLRLTASDYPFGILWPLYCLSFDLRLLITSLVSCGHCIVCPSTYGFWLPLWFLQTFLTNVVSAILYNSWLQCEHLNLLFLLRNWVSKLHILYYLQNFSEGMLSILCCTYFKRFTKMTTSSGRARWLLCDA